MVAIFLHLAPFDFSQPSIILLIIAGSLCAILMAARIGISLWNRADVRIFEENDMYDGPFKAKAHGLRNELNPFLGECCIRICQVVNAKTDVA